MLDYNILYEIPRLYVCNTKPHDTLEEQLYYVNSVIVPVLNKITLPIKFMSRSMFLVLAFETPAALQQENVLRSLEFQKCSTSSPAYFITSKLKNALDRST